MPSSTLRHSKPNNLIPAPGIERAFYEQDLAIYAEPTPERAKALLGLAEALRNTRDGDWTAHLTQAEKLVREALAILSQTEEGYEWAHAQNTHGLILASLPTGDRATNLKQAIDCYQAALRVYTQESFPYEFAVTQYNRSLALRELGEGHAAYEASLAAMRAYGGAANKDALLTEITQRIVAAFHPQKIVLFGSNATGKQRETSDLDLLVIMDSEETGAKRIQSVYEVASAPFPLLPMDILVYTPAEIAQRQAIGDFFLKEILSQGKVLYNRDSV